MTARRLLSYDQREAARRQPAASGMARLLATPRDVSLAVGTLAGIVLLIVRLAVDGDEARAWWLAFAVIATTTMVLRGPWRLFWRPDATILARLPIPGRSLYRRAAVHDAQLGLEVTLALSLATFAWFRFFPWSWLRALAVLFTVVASAIGISAAAATTGGALFASKKTERLMAEMSGEGAPSVAWLTIVPSLGGLYVGSLWYLLWPFAIHGELDTPLGPVWLVLSGSVIVAAIAYLAGEFLASRTLAMATREVAALDAVRLAHVDLEAPRPVERAFGRLVLGAPLAKLFYFYRKDISLLRRRYPAFYLLSGLCIAVEWILAFAAGDTREPWIIGLSAGLCAYAALLGHRLVSPPVERLRLVYTLPLPLREIVRAKSAYVIWRATWPVLLGALPAVLRSPAPMVLGLVVLAIMGSAMGVGLWLCRVRRHEDPR
jgi:hypothetical protein